jgi:drug/metabolite transporter (DMT)-like permease
MSSYQDDDTQKYLDYTNPQTPNEEGVTTTVIPSDESLNQEKQKKENAPENLRCTFVAFCAFMLLGAIWGSAFLFIRYGVDEKHGFPPMTLVMLRLVVASVFMLLLLGFNCIISKELRAAIRKYSGFEVLVKFAILGFFNNFIPFVAVGIAEQIINTGVVSIIDSSIPLFGLVFAHFALKGEKMSFLKVVGLLIGFAGVILCCFQKVTSGEPFDLSEFWGYVLVTIASASYAVASVFSKKYLSGIPGLYIATGQIISAAIMCTIGSLIWDLGLDPRHYRFFATANYLAWISVLYLSLFSTVVAYILYFYLIRTIGSVKQTMVGYLLPVFGVLFGAVFLKEWEGVEWFFIFSEVVGAVMITAGIALVSFTLPERITRPFSNAWQNFTSRFKKQSNDGEDYGLLADDKTQKYYSA